MKVLLFALALRAWGAETPLDPALSARAEVVLRVTKADLKTGGCDKYCWPTVTILKVLKNKSKQRFAKSQNVRIAYLSSSHALPVGEFTVYLERYGNGPKLWKVLDGKTELGVTDIAYVKKAPRTDCPKGTHPHTGMTGEPGCCLDGAVCD